MWPRGLNYRKNKHVVGKMDVFWNNTKVLALITSICGTLIIMGYLMLELYISVLSGDAL